MIIKKIRMKNIRSYENLELEFPKGSLLLWGDIGTGKTSILLGIQFALFGLQPGQKGTSILRNGKDDASVYLEFEIDSNKIELERSIKRSKSGISQETNIIKINGNEEELSTSEMKNKVITLLDYPIEFAKKSNLLYKFTVYTPQEEMKAIIEERPEIRLDALRHVFGIDRYKRIQENAEILLQKIKEQVKIKEVEIREINLLKENFIKLSEERISLSKELTNFNIEREIVQKENDEIKEKIKSIEKTIEEKRKIDNEFSKLQVALEGKHDLRARMEREIVSMQKQISEKSEFSFERLKEIISLLDRHKKNYEELNSRYIEVSSSLSVLNSKKESSFQLKDKISAMDSCPTCFQPVSIEHKDKIAKRTGYDLEEIDREMVSKLEAKHRLQKEIENEKKLIRDYELDKTRLEQEKIKFEHQKLIDIKIKSDGMILERTMVEIREVEEKIRSFGISLGKYLGIEESFKRFKEEEERLNTKLRGKEIGLAEKKKELEILGKQTDILQKDIKNKEQVRIQVVYLRELQDWLEDKFLSLITITESNVMAKLRSEFSKIFSEWFSSLVPQELSVRLDEDFTPIIINQDYELDYEFLSGGERTAVALAYRLSLNQVLNSLLSRIKTKGLVILDEPTEGFSQEQLFKMRDIFEQLKSEQVILVSHEQKMEDFVDHVIRVKKDGTSSVEKVEVK
jgi:exonuclease SbcC